ncbi:MAG: 1-deoxy-D-xylulose-5-phosphate synthase [Chloroflexi bacterium]|nr:1-deoxy-D-xylulose-5-phosphate synthase [Chloroflexota bacterium]
MTRLLDQIEGPADVQRLAPEQLPQLAAEIRAELLDTVPKTGGHLASNLGTVELAIALHRVFHSPVDKLVWDVGHQAYPHKLLTGRARQFHTLRQQHGLAGFLSREESPHDAFGAGHAGTSISAALGMAMARDLRGERYHVVAIIGDGGLTAGMALEALNHAGHSGTRLIVVLNDNQMSIAPNVGAIARMLNRLRPSLHRASEASEHLVERLPLGGLAREMAKRAKRGAKAAVLPTLLWEELGFMYVGPVNGHDEAELESVLRWVRDNGDRPTLVHVLTTKGKGHGPAEADPVKLHGVSPPGAAASAPTYTQVFGQTVGALMRQDERIVAITAAMPDGTGLTPVMKEFPERTFDVGICEQHAVTFAGGLATEGLVPIVAIYSTFLQRAYDQVIHDICVQNLPVVFALDRGGIVGDDGKTHQGLFDLAYLRVLPNMVVMAPADENELQHMVYTAVQHAAEGRGPIALRYPRGAGVGVPLEREWRRLPLGKGELLREGHDLGIVAIGHTVPAALEAAERLAERGISCAVVNARFVKPLDEELILRVADSVGALVTVEEHVLAGGFGAAILELLAAHGRRVPVERLGIPDVFVEHGKQGVLRAAFAIDAAGIARRALEAFPGLARTPAYR